jgi:hypothetical protein|tara:strand:+ start:2570 stop:3109 length:540 start_codon:yes stop_codon:yes gene_type:complete
MTQHEYIFIAVSIILGLAITRLLHTAAMITRAHNSVEFHWSSALWALSILIYILQLWWIGWGLRNIQTWTFFDFLVLVFGSILVYGSAEMALPAPDHKQLDMLHHNQHLGRLSAVFMSVYFLVGPYVNIVMLDNAIIPSLVFPSIGILLMLLIITLPRYFVMLSSLFAGYSLLILFLTV